MTPRLRLNVQRAFVPIEVCVFGVLHLGVTHARVQEQTMEQFFFIIHCRKHRIEFLLCVGLRWLLVIVEFRQDFAGLMLRMTGFAVLRCRIHCTSRGFVMLTVRPQLSLKNP